MTYTVKTPRSIPLKEEELKRIFQKLDVNNDGRLSWEEIVTAFRSQGLHMKHVRAFLAVHHADSDGNGFIDADEMKEFVKYTSDKWGISFTDY
ncbi:hypothetical protein Dimus_003186 [Dionaea muscipula]